ncbi:hypothetical protein J2X60_003003 [Curtobacterium sp. 320]|uniref:hypothetical protein n=1 Tax=Curtobacterium sp. 320 TaxID=2817749 RepID=UPI0028677213|nr:hypothetical protein [Curtobacterium sp. 320]MDR6574344.1 hypothetical protein [Curtobacterium sp. 320]
MRQEEHLKRVAEVGERYEARIRNQIGTINRILAGGTYDAEMEALHVQLAEVTAERDRLLLAGNARTHGSSL